MLWLTMTRCCGWLIVASAQQAAVAKSQLHARQANAVPMDQADVKADVITCRGVTANLKHEADTNITQCVDCMDSEQAVLHTGSARTYVENSAVEVQPDSMLLSQVVPQLPDLTVHLKHRCNILLSVCGHSRMQLLHLVRTLHSHEAIFCKCNAGQRQCHA